MQRQACWKGRIKLTNKIRKYIPGIVLLDTLLLVVLLATARFALHLSGLMFRKWFTIICLLAITTGIIAGILQLLLKIRKRSIRILAVTLYVIITIAITLMIYPIAIFAVAGEEHVVEREEGKYVAYVDGFLHTYVYYYEYKNFLICGETRRIEEDYGKGGFDPIGNPYGYEYTAISTTYYDEEGNIVSAETEDQ